MLITDVDTGVSMRAINDSVVSSLIVPSLSVSDHS